MIYSRDLILISYHPGYSWHRYEGRGRYSDECKNIPSEFEFDIVSDEQEAAKLIAYREWQLEQLIESEDISERAIEWEFRIVQASSFDSTPDRDDLYFDTDSQFDLSDEISKMAQTILCSLRKEEKKKRKALQDKKESAQLKRQREEEKAAEIAERTLYETLRKKFGDNP